MRVAVLGDVHGNAFALQAVLEDIRAASPDVLINLGDQVEGAAHPARAAELQQEILTNVQAVEVRGNNEEKLWPGGRRNALSVQFGAWLATQVPPGTLERLAALPLTSRVGEVFACHGTPQSAWESLLWVWDNGVDGNGFYRSRDPRDLRQLVAPLQAGVVVCGHTHRAGATRVGDTLVVNSGPVSDQVDGDPRARWTLLEKRSSGWSVDFRAVIYDVEAAVTWATTHSPFGAYSAELLRSGELTGRSAGSL